MPPATSHATVPNVARSVLKQMLVALRERWFVAPYPADTIVEVRSLYAREAMVEIEAIAVVDAAVET